jgi:oxalate decarboxylase/phosphoglucose isomerase-like protein (cupin superfamily)
VTSPRHTHPGEEIIYVLEGLLEYQVEGKPPVTLKAGDVLFIPAGTVHAAKNVGSGNAAELATYVVEKGKPLSRWCLERRTASSTAANSIVKNRIRRDRRASWPEASLP